MSRIKAKLKTIARKESAKTELRETILAAARKMVLEKGFGELSIRKLADAVGYAPGTIYLYFKNRDEITSEICVRGFAELFDEMRTAADIADPFERLTALLKIYAVFAVKNPETYRLSFMEDPKFSEEIFRTAPLDEGTGRQAFNMIVKAVRELKETGRIAAEDENLLAEMLWTGVHGVVSLKLIYPAFPASPTEKLVNKMISALLAGMLKSV